MPPHAPPFWRRPWQEHHDAEQKLIDSLAPRIARSVVHLGQLNVLEARRWRYHAGDVPYAEAASLDDSVWQTSGGGMSRIQLPIPCSSRLVERLLFCPGAQLV